MGFVISRLALSHLSHSLSLVASLFCLPIFGSLSLYLTCQNTYLIRRKQHTSITWKIIVLLLVGVLLLRLSNPNNNKKNIMPGYESSRWRQRQITWTSNTTTTISIIIIIINSLIRSFIFYHSSTIYLNQMK